MEEIGERAYVTVSYKMTILPNQLIALPHCLAN